MSDLNRILVVFGRASLRVWLWLVRQLSKVGGEKCNQTLES